MPTRATQSAILVATAWLMGLLTDTAQAQTTAPAGTPRYMSWAGRPSTTRPASVIAAEREAEVQAQTQTATPIAQAPTPRAMIARRIAPSQAVNRPTMQPVPTSQPALRGPTPASAWLDPQPVSAFAPGSPDPLAYTRDQAIPVAAADTTDQPAWSSAPAQAAAQVQEERPTQPQFLPGPPVPQAAAIAQAAASVAPAAADPMAPRPDALIFRLRPQAALQQASAQGDAPAPQVYAEAAAPVSAQPGQPTSRYYSVHREAGHAPDRTPLPEAVFYDSVALDLAEPPETQTPQRDAQGRLRPPVRDDDPERP